MMTFLLILLFIAISLIDLPKLIKKKKKKELFVYTFILGTAFLLSELHILRVKVWSLNRLITELVHYFIP